ncbi:MAG: site-specific integrase, partial [SAR324 cluster bacterium]|nr:site-specific integrase [SAR324 cluster bacterium]
MTYRSYLVRKNSSSSYLLNIKIPRDLREYFGRNQFKISLKNGIHSQSLLFAKVLYLEVQSIFSSIRMGTISKITVKQVKDILKDKIERTLNHSKHIVVDTNTFIESEVKDKIEEVNGEERILRTQLEKNYDGVLEHIEKEIARIIKSKDLTIDSKSLEFKELRKQFLELRLIRSKWKKELLEDSGKSVNDFRNEIYKKFNIEGEQLTPVIENYAPEPTQPYLVEKEDKPSQIDVSPKLSEMKEEFIGERLLSGFSPKSTRELESTIDDLIEIIGDIPILKVTPNNARDFKKIISSLPKYRNQSPRYRGLTIKQILSLDGVEGQEPKNINKLIYRVRVFFKWLKNNYSEYVPQNHFDGLSIQEKKFDKPRDIFTNKELHKIFDTTPFLNNTIRNPHRRNKLASYFVPIIAIHTGMRLEEICQLRLEDVYKEGTVDIIRVTISKETKLKTVTSQRIVPIHENLKRVGFLEYCNYMKKQKKERVFWDLTKSRDGYGRNIGRYFMEYLRKVGVYEFQSKVFHSLRHSFITNLLQNGVREEVVNGLCGHKQKTMSTTIYF